MSRILFVTRDIAGMALLGPLAKALKTLGQQVKVMAEGQSIKMWSSHIDYEVVPSTGDGHDIPVLLGLVEEADMVITSLGRPIWLERLASIFARGWASKKLVWHPDIWGGERRITEVAPDLLLMNDMRVPLAKHVEGVKVAEVGSCYLWNLLNADRSKAIMLREQSDKKLVFLAAQGEYSLDFIDWLADPIASLKGEWEVCASLHPKYKETFGPRWEKALQHKLEGRLTNRFEGVSADHIATVADMTVSAYSTVLLASAAFMGGAVSVSTPATRNGMLEGMGVDKHPLVDAGFIYEATWPRQLQDLLRGRRAEVGLIPKVDPVETATRAVLDLLR